MLSRASSVLTYLGINAFTAVCFIHGSAGLMAPLAMAAFTASFRSLYNMRRPIVTIHAVHGLHIRLLHRIRVERIVVGLKYCALTVGIDYAHPWYVLRGGIHRKILNRVSDVPVYRRTLSLTGCASSNFNKHVDCPASVCRVFQKERFCNPAFPYECLWPVTLLASLSCRTQIFYRRRNWLRILMK